MFQQLMLIGHVGQQPEMRYTPSGTAVANFSLAVNKRSTNAEGQVQEKTTWFRVTMWEKKAELASQYLHKGSKVMVVGEINEARPWTDQSGNLRASLEMTAHELRFLDSRGREQDEGANKATSSEPSQEAAPADIPF
ncbi:MAG: single-stranded DNA-binding protein [Caldilineaceae bacterium]